MTLSPLATIVKRLSAAWLARAWLTLAGVLAGAGATVALMDLELSAQAQARMDRFGTTTASMAAQLGLPHVVQQKRLELESLAKRIIELDGVQSCSFYTVDGRTLAFAGNATGQPDAGHYPASVTVDDSLAGFARVVLDADRFKPESLALIASVWPIWAGALAAALALALHSAWLARPKPPAPAEPAKPTPSTADVSVQGSAVNAVPALAAEAATPATEGMSDARAAEGMPDASIAATERDASATATEQETSVTATEPDAPVAAIEPDASDAVPEPDAPDAAAEPDAPDAPAERAPQPEALAATPAAKAPAPTAAPAPEAAARREPPLVLVARLFNADSLASATKAKALNAARNVAHDVARAHGGVVDGPRDAHAVLRFPATDGLEATAAGLELARRIQTAERDGAQFRCALHRTEHTDGHRGDPLADALLLATLAPPRRLALSEAALRCIKQPRRVRATAIPERSVGALAATTLGRCHIVDSVRG